MKEKENKDTTTFMIGKLSCEIREPNFKELQLGLSAFTTTTGNMDMVGGGKIIFDLCCVSCDEDMKKPKNLMSLCIELAKEYLVPVDVIIKKK